MDALFYGGMFAFAYFWHLAIAVVLSGPIILAGWDRARYQGWEALAFLLPFVAWMVCTINNDGGKGLWNFILEPVAFLSPAIAASAAVRVLSGHPRWSTPFASALVGLLCVTSVCVWWLTPGLSE